MKFFLALARERHRRLHINLCLTITGHASIHMYVSNEPMPDGVGWPDAPRYTKARPRRMRPS
eukprot:scaffold102237_cov37-Prasinocladus_malaysianus.AAC.1